MNDTRETLAQFVERNVIGIIATLSAWRPSDGADWNEPGQRHWNIQFATGGRGPMTTRFHTGSAHTAPPTAEDVLSCLASDASSVDNAQSFEDWASELGFDPDSRKAERLFKACELSAERLRTFLGDAEYQRLLWETEQL